MHLPPIFALALATACSVLAQDPAQPAFEVVSVKPSPPGGGPMGIGLYTYPGGRINATSYRLRYLIHDAYDVELYQIVGGPHWLDEDRFDIEAKPPASSDSARWVPASFKTPPNSEMRRMLQSLLAERFHLAVHRETRKQQIYVLTVAKGGPKLKPPASITAEPFVSFLPRGYAGRNATIGQLADRLAQNLHRPVFDRTGIPGHFDFRIEYPPDEAGTDDNVILLSALQDQVGLKLETRPGAVDVIVVDHAEKPTAN
jgi:uncharacterized protein (TIGR03435 family)